MDRREYQRNYQRQHENEYKEKNLLKLEELLGNKCIVCGSKSKPYFHEIHGKKHPNSLWFIIAHYKDFVRCKECNSKRERDRYWKNPEFSRQQDRKNYHKDILASRERLRNYDRKLRRKIKNILGNKCAICGKVPKRGIYCHEKNLNKHRPDATYILNHIKDFIPLCQKHHIALHIIIKYPNEFKKILMEISKE